MKAVIFAVFMCFQLQLSNGQGNTNFKCNFDEDFCQFSNDPTGALEWDRQQGPTFTDDTGPESDHTTGDPDGGYYLYMEASRASTGDFARTLSSLIPGTAGTCATISFYYHMYGEDIGSLNLYVVQEPPPYEYDNPIWGLSGNQGNQWIKAEVNVTLPLDIKLVFEGFALRGIIENKGDIAIDDVSVVTGNCETSTCDPTIPWCRNGGTCVDVSNNATADDYYVCLCLPGWEGVHCETDADECASNPCANGGTCTHGVNSYQCFCDLGYHGKNCEYDDQCVSPELHRCENGGTCVPHQDDYNCTCVPGYTGANCETEIDECWESPCVHGNCTDSVNDYTCSCESEWVGRNCNISKGGCEFDSGYISCGYTTSPTVDYFWKQNSGSTPNFNTGPSSDHTTGQGAYMFADGSNEDPSGNARALLYSPIVTSQAVGHCSIIKFWYYMSGGSVGTLNLYVSGSGNNELETNPVWSTTGEQGEFWIEGSVAVSSTVQYKLLFEAVTAPALVYAGDVAIDDVNIFPDQCEFSTCSGRPCQNGGTCFENELGQFVCECAVLWTGPTCTEDSNLCLSNPCMNGGTCVDEYQSYSCVCDTSMFVGKQCEYLLGSCDFDDPLLPSCKYTFDEFTEFQWTRWTGSTPSELTGPDEDHTTGSGYYLYAEATGRSQGDKARVYTPIVPQSGGGCSELSFWYLMRGNNIGELAVHIEVQFSPLPSPIWVKVGDDRNGWTNFKINVSVPYDFRVVFEAIMRDEPLIEEDNRGDIAIDDVIIKTDVGCSYESCFIQPCQNGGTCVAEADDKYQCLCLPDYSGLNCELITQCDPNPCNNGGVCSLDENNLPFCLCRPGFTGPTCDDIDYCFPDPCLNNGTCVSDTAYECICQDGYEGTQCESEVNECLSSPCMNGGTCMDLLNAYSCQCSAYFIGDNCEKVTGSCDFENDQFCGWVPDPKTDYNWIINSGAGSNWPLSGPSYDHTHQSLAVDGYYVYTLLFLEDPEEGSVYRIRSPTFVLSNYNNNKFMVGLHYHAKGDSIGILNVYIEESGIPERSIFSFEGEQGNDWLPMSREITVNNDWSIVIEHKTVRSRIFMGDLAVDDVVVTLVPQTSRIVFFCDFDQDFCQFSSDPLGELEWDRKQGPTFTDDTGPESDHTTGDPDGGFYVFIDVTGARTGDFARSLSSLIPGTAGTCATISFYYHMYGEDIGSLNLYVVQEPPPYEYDNPIWGLSGNQGNQWMRAEVNVTLPLDFKLVFEGTAKLGVIDNAGDIAIDDMMIETGRCAPVSCDPSVSWCRNGGTCVDVSNNATADEYYVCLCPPGWEGVHCETDADECASNPCANGGTCTHGVNSYQCFCDLGYHGNNCEFIDKCVDFDLNRCENGATCFPVDNDLNCACAPGYTGSFCEVEINECDANPCVNGVCSDEINGYTCSCNADWVGKNCHIHLGGCDFDQGMDACGYSAYPRLDYLWLTNTGNTPNFNTGPDFDHTTGSGVYVFADASNADNGNERARLYSPTVTSSAVGTCSKIIFWYYMSGNTVGTLNLYASGTGNNELETNPIWSISGEQGDQWRQGDVSLSSEVPYSLVFEAVTVPFLVYAGDIAIDDVDIIPKSCEYLQCSGKPCQNGGTCFEDDENNFVCSCAELWTGPTCIEDSNLCLSNPCMNGGTCIDEYQSYSCICDTNMFVGKQCEYLLGSCDFEDPALQTCNYENDPEGDFSWDVWSGSTPSDLTGPVGDHTTGSGYYLYAEATDRVGGERAIIRSPIVPGSGGGCNELSFWYFLRGGNIGELAVHIVSGIRPLPTPIWTKEGDYRNEWTNFKINISVPEDFRVVFEAVMRDKSIIEEDNRGDIAIDDVIIKTNVGCSYESCFMQPCQNGGTCVAEAEGTYQCICPPEFGGLNCESIIQCEPNPCQNEGVCAVDANNEIICLCLPGFAGKNCEKVDYCYPDPCFNNGTCVSDTAYECICRDGYEGSQCESEVNECLSSPCMNGGTCMDLLNAYSCQCSAYFIGDNCEKVVGSCSFEERSFCGWGSDPRTDYDWGIDSGSGSNWPLSGPMYDHTYQSLQVEGYYVYTELYRQEPSEGSLYRIRSPTFLLSNFANNVFTVELFYHMKGSGVGRFSIYIAESGEPERQIFQVEGEQGSDWLPFKQVVTVSNNWAIVVEHRTIKTPLFMGDVAIDDVTITQVQAPPATTTTAATTTEKTTTAQTTTSNPTTLPGITTTTSPSTEGTVGQPDGGDGGINAGEIAGLVIGIVAAICLLLASFYYIVVRPGRKQSEVRKSLQEKSTYDFGIENPNFTL